MSVLRRITKYFKGAKLLLTDLKMMSLLDIAECGVDSENIPYIQLRSGETFYSFLPKKSERAIYKKYRKTLPNSLIEDSFRVALDIIQRFYRENSGSHIPRKTHHLYPGWGFIDLGAYLGFGAIKAARKVGQTGKVIAVEASPQVYLLLVKNIKANKLDNVVPVHAAVQDHNGPVNFFMADRQNNSIHQFLGILHRTPKVVYTFRVFAKNLIFFMTCRTHENKALQVVKKISTISTLLKSVNW